MAANRWLGVAKPTIAKKAFMPTSVSPGSVWRMRIGSESYEYTYSGSTIDSLVTEKEKAQAVAEGLAGAVSGLQFEGGATQVVGSVTAQLVEGKWAVVVTGTSDGTPLDVSVDVAEATEGNVKVVVLQEGQAAQNQKQFLQWPKTPTGGSIRVGLEGDHDDVVYNAGAATLQTALEGLSSIGAGNCSVTGSYLDGYEIEFIGALAGTEVALLRAFSVNATGTAAVSYEVNTRGGVAKATFTMSSLNGDSESVYEFEYEESKSHYFTGASTKTEILSALESIEAIGSGNVTVDELEDGTFSISLISSLFGVSTGSLSATSIDSTSTAPTIEKTGGSTTPTASVITITILNSPGIISGTITLGYDTAINLQTVSTMTTSTLSSAFGSYWSCTALTKTKGQPIVIEFTALDSSVHHGIVTADVSAMVGCYAIDTRVTQQAKTAVNEIQQVSLVGDPDGGTFTLTLGANTTAALAYNISAASLQTALTGLASIGGGNATVTGSDGGPWVVTFVSGKAATDMDSITGDGASLTIASESVLTTEELQAPTGPNFWTDSNNWSLARVPDNTDTATFNVGSVPCKYGITDVPAIAGLEVYRSYTGEIGLPEFREDGVPETLDTYLSLSDLGAKITISLGLGDDGDGPTLVRINTKDQEADIKVLYSQQAQDDYIVGLAGDIATLQIGTANVAVATHGIITATVDALRMSPSGDSANEAVCEWGAGATITYAEILNGAVRGGSIPASITASNAAVSIRGSGDCNQVVNRGSRIRWLGSGAIGRQGLISALDVSGGELEVTSTAHGLSSGDKVFVRGLPSISVEDGYYVIEKVDADTFLLLGTAPAIPYGASTPATVSSYYETNTARWGLVNTVRLGEGAILDMSEVGEVRSIVAPIVLQAISARVLDPQVTVDDLRLHADPGFFDEDFGLNGIYRREQAISAGVLGSSYTNSGIV